MMAINVVFVMVVLDVMNVLNIAKTIEGIRRVPVNDDGWMLVVFEVLVLGWWGGGGDYVC